MVGAGALVHRAGRILLVKRKNEPNRGRWALPGGLVELGETVENAVKREVREEVGLDIRLIGLLDVADDIHYDSRGRAKYHYILIDFLARPIGGKVRLNSESSTFKWFNPDHIQRVNTSDNTRKVVRRYLSGMTYSRKMRPRGRSGRPTKPPNPLSSR